MILFPADRLWIAEGEFPISAFLGELVHGDALRLALGAEERIEGLSRFPPEILEVSLEG